MGRRLSEAGRGRWEGGGGRWDRDGVCDTIRACWVDWIDCDGRWDGDGGGEW